MSAPRVSVILPTHDRLDLLRRALASVLGQTLADIEVIVIDNACSDGTSEFLKGHADARLRSIRFDTLLGASAARNAAIRLARAPLLAFQDDDDFWLPQKLARQVAVLDAAGPGTGLCLAGYLRLFSDRVQGVYAPDYLQRMNFDRGVIMADYSAIPTPGWLARREAIEQAGGFDENLPARNDWELALRLSALCSFAHVPEALWVQDQTRPTSMRKSEQRYAQALKHIVAKHPARWARWPEVRASHAELIGRYEVSAGNLEEGREWLRSSLKDFWRFRVEALLLLSRFGDGAVVKLRALRQSLRR